jgi:hypothetical protein
VDLESIAMNLPLAGFPQPSPSPVPEIGREGLLAGGDPTGIRVAQPGNSETLGLITVGAGAGGFVRNAMLLAMQGVDQLSMMMAVVLSVQRDGNTDPGDENTTFPIRAEITFSQGGTGAALEVDFINGALLSLPASNLRLQAFIDTTDDLAQYPVKVAAMASYLPVPHARQAQRTLRASLAAAQQLGSSTILAIPRFAQTVTLLSDSPGTQFTLSQCTDRLGANVIVQQTIPASPPCFDIPLINEARYLKVANLSAGAVKLRALFGLYV